MLLVNYLVFFYRSEAGLASFVCAARRVLLVFTLTQYVARFLTKGSHVYIFSVYREVGGFRGK